MLGVTAVQKKKVKSAEPVSVGGGSRKKQTNNDGEFDDLVAKYKKKIQAKL